jgi:hypothetical protein
MSKISLHLMAGVPPGSTGHILTHRKLGHLVLGGTHFFGGMITHRPTFRRPTFHRQRQLVEKRNTPTFRRQQLIDYDNSSTYLKLA